MTSDRPLPETDGLSLVAAVVAVLALIGTLFGVGLGMRAVDESKTNRAASTKAVAESVTVHEKEFSISPSAINVGQGGSLKVENDGTMVHNLQIVGHDEITPDIQPGKSATLDLSKLPAGSYEVQCAIPGHAAAGMKGTLVIGAGGTAAGTTATTMKMTPDAMDKGAHDAVAKFPAKTEGLGAQVMDPTIVNGVKVFDLTAKAVKWEVEPGKFVDAWTYNGVAPGPTIHVNVGDHVRVILHNQLPESTSIHFHGIKVPNAMDGVPDITQDAVKPGTTFTYEFTTQEPAVGIYHSHHDGSVQVPNGQFGAFLVGEMPVPSGVTVSQEFPMILNDAGTIGLSLNGKSFPATAPVVAKQGDYFLVHYMNEGLLVHPMHLHGMPGLVVAKDGFPLAQPYYADTVLVGPGERYSVLVHATEVGTWAWHCHILSHAENPQGALFGMTTALVVNKA